MQSNTDNAEIYQFDDFEKYVKKRQPILEKEDFTY